ETARFLEWRRSAARHARLRNVRTPDDGNHGSSSSEAEEETHPSRNARTHGTAGLLVRWSHNPEYRLPKGIGVPVNAGHARESTIQRGGALRRHPFDSVFTHAH